MNIETITRAYITAALWSSTDNEDEPLDTNYFPSDIHPETLQEMRDDVALFVSTNETLLESMGVQWGQSLSDRDERIGHDFWLTRNGHGAGFWDRGLGEIGDKLTEACKPFGEVFLYVGDDGKIHA